MPKKNRVPELDFFNAIACLLVILIHVLSDSVSLASPASWQGGVVFFLWKIPAFVVPAFLFVGAVKVSLHMPERLTAREYFRYMKGRVLRVYLPYIIWNLIYYAVFLKIGYVKGSLAELVRYILVGNLSAPFYYVVITMQFYLLLPLWKLTLEKISPLAALPCALLVTFASFNGDKFISMLIPGFAYSSRMFYSYLIFWVMGLYAGRYYKRFTEEVEKLTAPSAVMSAVFILAHAALAYLQQDFAMYLFDLRFFKIAADVLSIFLLFALCLRIKKSAGVGRIGAKLTSLLTRVHGSSFFVYLSHALILTLTTIVLDKAGISDLTLRLAVEALAGFTIPFLLYWAAERVKTVVKSKIKPS